MKLSYDAATDSLYIHLSERVSVDSDEVVEGVRRIARLIHGDGSLLREGLLQAAGGQEGCADKQRCCKFYGLFHR